MLSLSPSLTLLTTLHGHSDRVWCCAFSPNGRALATCGGDKQIRIWREDDESHAEGDKSGDGGGGVTEDEKDQKNATTSARAPKWTCKQVLDGTHTRTIRFLSWSPNGKYLASAGFDGITAIWENQDGEFDCVATLEGHENEVKCVSWSRNGEMLATCSRDKSVWIWSSESSAESVDKEFECLSVLNGHTQDVKVAKWHPTIESMLISASYDNSIKVWTEEDDDWYATETLNGHTSTVWSISFNRDGSKMISCSDDKSMILWERSNQSPHPSTDSSTTQSNNVTGSWRLRQKLTGQHERCIYTVDWAKNDFVASGAADDSICIFGPRSSSINNASTAATTDAPPIASSNEPLALLHTEKNAHAGDVNCVQWNPVEPSILCSAGDDGAIKIWQWKQ